MRWGIAILAVLFACAAAAGKRAGADGSTQTGVVVVMQTGSSPTQLSQTYRVNVQDVTADGTMAVVTSSDGTSATDLARIMANDTRIVAAETNGGIHSPEILAQWITAFDGGGVPTVVDQPLVIPDQVDYGTTGALADGTGVTVAILDTGISTRHTALAGRVLPGWNFVNNSSDTDDAPAQVDSDGNGVADEAVGHGTAVAGI